MYRIEVSSSSAGAANLTFGVNPVEYDPNDSFNIFGFNSINMPTVYGYRPHDSRERKLRWDRFSVSSADINQINDYFRSIEGQIRYFNFRDMDNINKGWDIQHLSSASWKKARIISMRSEYQKGGKLKYDIMELTIQPEK